MTLLNDLKIVILAFIPSAIIQSLYYMIDQSFTYFLPVFFISLMPSTLIVFYLVSKDNTKLQSLESGGEKQ